MHTRMTPARRVDEEVVNEEVPPRGEKVPQGNQVPQVKQVPIDNQGNEVPVVPPWILLMRKLEEFFLP